MVNTDKRRKVHAPADPGDGVTQVTRPSSDSIQSSEQPMTTADSSNSSSQRRMSAGRQSAGAVASAGATGTSPDRASSSGTPFSFSSNGNGNGRPFNATGGHIYQVNPPLVIETTLSCPEWLAAELALVHPAHLALGQGLESGGRLHRLHQVGVFEHTINNQISRTPTIKSWSAVSAAICKAWGLPMDRCIISLIYDAPPPPASAPSGSQPPREREAGEFEPKRIVIDSEEEWSLLFHLFSCHPPKETGAIGGGGIQLGRTQAPPPPPYTNAALSPQELAMTPRKRFEVVVRPKGAATGSARTGAGVQTTHAARTDASTGTSSSRTSAAQTQTASSADDPETVAPQVSSAPRASARRASTSEAAPVPNPANLLALVGNVLNLVSTTTSTPAVQGMVMQGVEGILRAVQGSSSSSQAQGSASSSTTSIPPLTPASSTQAESVGTLYDRFRAQTQAQSSGARAPDAATSAPRASDAAMSALAPSASSQGARPSVLSSRPARAQPAKPAQPVRPPTERVREVNDYLADAWQRRLVEMGSDQRSEAAKVYEEAAKQGSVRFVPDAEDEGEEATTSAEAPAEPVLAAPTTTESAPNDKQTRIAELNAGLEDAFAKMLAKTAGPSSGSQSGARDTAQPTPSQQSSTASQTHKGKEKEPSTEQQADLDNAFRQMMQRMRSDKARDPADPMLPTRSGVPSYGYRPIPAEAAAALPYATDSSSRQRAAEGSNSRASSEEGNWIVLKDGKPSSNASHD